MKNIIGSISPDKVKFFSKSIGSLVLLKPMLKRMKIAEIIGSLELQNYGSTPP